MLRAMFSLDMKEKEASEIDVVDVSPETLAQMIEFMYTGNVDELDERADELLGESRICGDTDSAEPRGRVDGVGVRVVVVEIVVGGY